MMFNPSQNSSLAETVGVANDNFFEVDFIRRDRGRGKEKKAALGCNIYMGWQLITVQESKSKLWLQFLH